MTLETREDLLERNRDLQARLDEAEETLRALRNGGVDAIVASGPDGDRVYTLKGTDEAYRVMVQTMADGALTLGLDGLILYANEQFASLIEIPLERVIGSSIHDFIAAEDASSVAALLRVSVGAKAEVRLKKGPGTLAPVQISANPLWLDETECVCFIVMHLSEQTRNRELVAAERLALSVLDQAASAILVVDPSGRIMRASRVAEQMAGGSVPLRRFDEAFSLRADSEGQVYTFEKILSAVRRYGIVTGLAAIARMPDGRTLDVMVSAALLVGPDSECLGCTIVLADVGGLKRAERAVHESIRKVTELNRELEAFTYSVSHDLRTPLRHIDAFSEILAGEAADHLSNSGRVAIARIRSGALLMSRMIDDLLDFSRMSRQDLNKRPTNFRSVVDESLELLKSDTDGRDIDLRIGELPHWNCDPALMKHVMVNLLSNAIKFSRGRKPAVVEVGQFTGKGSAGVFVRDNGAGFDMRYVHRLFGVFQRLHRTEEFEGLGVGLAMVQRIIHRHGGRVWAESEAGKGATFYFTVNDPQENGE